MLNFSSDYMECAHPRILDAIAHMNFEKNPGYGTDDYCARAQEKIRTACACPEASVHFLVGGTQANCTVIDAVLHRCECVLSAETGHINVHEAGAVEASGHKIIALPATEGKLSAAEVAAYYDNWMQDENRDHTTAPGMVYLSHPTEYGTLYTKAELEAMHAVCAKRGLPLFVDGARLGYGLAAACTDVTLPVLGANCDVFYIGGTKVGALFGEAVVFTNPALVRYFFTLTKQHGALLAKGFLLGVQFETLFTDGLYLEISAHAIRLAEKLDAALREKGYRFALATQSNQIFVVLTNEQYDALKQKVGMGFWEKPDASHTTVRLATSWATTESDVDALIALL